MKKITLSIAINLIVFLSGCSQDEGERFKIEIDEGERINVSGGFIDDKGDMSNHFDSLRKSRFKPGGIILSCDKGGLPFYITDDAIFYLTGKMSGDYQRIFIVQSSGNYDYPLQIIQESLLSSYDKTQYSTSFKYIANMAVWETELIIKRDTLEMTSEQKRRGSSQINRGKFGGGIECKILNEDFYKLLEEKGNKLANKLKEEADQREQEWEDKIEKNRSNNKI